MYITYVNNTLLLAHEISRHFWAAYGITECGESLILVWIGRLIIFRSESGLFYVFGLHQRCTSFLHLNSFLDRIAVVFVVFLVVNMMGTKRRRAWFLDLESSLISQVW